MPTKQIRDTLKPIEDRVAVRQFDATEEKIGSIYIPEGAREQPQQGEVLAVGPGRFEAGHQIPMPFQPGQTVLFGKFSGVEVEVHGEPVLILRTGDILAIIEE